MKKLILGLLSALALLPGGMLRSGDVRAAETFAVQSPRRDHCANPHANCHGERYEDRRGRYQAFGRSSALDIRKNAGFAAHNSLGRRRACTFISLPEFGQNPQDD